MRIHTNLDTPFVYNALERAQDAHRVAHHVIFEKMDKLGSRSRERAFEVRLSTEHKVKRDGRYHLNTGKYGAHSDRNAGLSLYSATYDEYGWFIAELFRADPDAIVGRYKGFDDFTTQTQGKYNLTKESVAA